MSKLLNKIDGTTLQITYFDLLTKVPIIFTEYPQATRQPKLVLPDEPCIESPYLNLMVLLISFGITIHSWSSLLQTFSVTFI